jgi:DNA polymerase delta subunit 1
VTGNRDTKMELFVYRWEYKNGIMYGSIPYSLWQGNIRHICVDGFSSWIYIPGDSFMLKSLQGSEIKHVDKVPGGSAEDAVLQFVAITNISRCGWVTVPDYRCSVWDVKPGTKMDIPKMHIMAFDIECYSQTGAFPDPHNKDDAIICIGTVSNIHGAKTFAGDEDNFIREFYSYILNADIITGYNTHMFDWSYILKRHAIYDKSRLEGIYPKWVQQSWSSVAFKHNEISYLDIPGILSLDLYNYAQRTFTIENYKLDTVAEYFGLDGKMDMPMSRLWKAYETGDLTDVIAYCEKDCSLVLDIIDKCGMVQGVFGLASVTSTDPNALFTRGQQLRVKCMLTVECERNGYMVEFANNSHAKYQGAYVLDPTPGMYDNCACMDFASLYPSIIVANNICYSTYRNDVFDKSIPGVIPRLVMRLIRERDNIRNDKSLEAYSNALKISTNSIYGVFGAEGSLCLTFAASEITRLGREYLSRAVDWLTSHGFEVIYGDTDSCFYTNGTRLTEEEHEDIADKVSSLFEFPVKMKYEAMYDRLLVMGKKMYIMMTTDGILKYKGVMAARRDSCIFERELYKEIAHRVMSDIPFRDYVRDIIININTIPRDKFMLKKKYNGPYKSESFPMHIYNARFGPFAPGTTVFVIIGTSEKAGLLGDKMFPYESDVEIDYEWYLKHLVPQVDNIMECAGKVFRLKNNYDLYKNYI